MTKSNYKLCILSAGKGTRNRSIKGLHKSLLPLNNKAVISHIIESVNQEVEIVIAIGYKGKQVKNYIQNVFPERKITFVEVENYDGLGSGPGLSLLYCEPHLQCPFVFTSADTIVSETNKIQIFEENWIGTSFIEKSLSNEYCLIEGDTHLSKLYYGSGDKAYNGMAGIHDYITFWDSLKLNKIINGEYQVIHGLEGLKDIKLKYFNWYDTGNLDSYKKTKITYNQDIVAPKKNEAIFIEGKKVIKYFSDENKMNRIVSRIQFLNGTHPDTKIIDKNMFMYDYIQGNLLSDTFDENVLKDIVHFYLNRVSSIRFEKNKQFLDNCRIMYRDKLFSRIEKFSNSDLDLISKINGVEVQPINEMLNMIDWELIYEKAIPSTFHGDFQPENIIYDGKKFKLIDWRESFGNSLEVGDLYYDLGKLYHALLINGNYVLDKRYGYSIKDNEAVIRYDVKNNVLFILNYLETFCQENSLCWENTQLLGILQYIGISSLYENFHNGEYGNFLFLLGKYLLSKYHKETNI
ncbi:MAG: hypothetical protein ACW99F_00940 [Candidatus Hodarchaeales archaeon]|jgi:dTDP-glucose pyrophosphorylase